MIIYVMMQRQNIGITFLKISIQRSGLRLPLKHKCSFLGFSTNGHSYIKFRAEQSEIKVLL